MQHAADKLGSHRRDTALVIAAVGPEAKVNPQGFRAAVVAAERRLAETDPEERRSR